MANVGNVYFGQVLAVCEVSPEVMYVRFPEAICDVSFLYRSDFFLGLQKKSDSVTGNRTRACWVRASSPNH